MKIHSHTVYTYQVKKLIPKCTPTLTNLCSAQPAKTTGIQQPDTDQPQSSAENALYLDTENKIVKQIVTQSATTARDPTNLVREYVHDSSEKQTS